MSLNECINTIGQKVIGLGGCDTRRLLNDSPMVRRSSCDDGGGGEIRVRTKGDRSYKRIL